MTVHEAPCCPTNEPPGAHLVVVPRYVGMTRRDAIRFRFGTDEVPAGLTAVLLTNALPPVGVPYEWWSLERGSVEFEAAAAACREKAPGDGADGDVGSPHSSPP